MLKRLRYLSRFVGDEFLEARGDELPEKLRRSGDGSASERRDVRDAPLIGFCPHDSSRQVDDEGACTWFAATLFEAVEALYAHWWAVLQDGLDCFAMDCIGSRETREHVASNVRIGCLGPHLSAEYDARVEARAVVRVAMRERLGREFGAPAREDDDYDLERVRSASAPGPVQPGAILGDPTGPARPRRGHSRDRDRAGAERRSSTHPGPPRPRRDPIPRARWSAESRERPLGLAP